MIILLICIFVTCFYSIHFCRRNAFNHDYLDSQNTLAMKGLFTLLIFLSHFALYISMKKPLDLPYAVFKSYLAQAIVAPFMFLSGYGIMFSLIHKENYVKQMPVKRIWKTLFAFHCALILFFIVQEIKGRHFTPVYYLETIIAWDSLGNSDWYIFSILSMYILTYISFLVCGKKHTSGLICNAVLILVFTLFMKIHKGGYWYNIYFAYWFGMLYAFRKNIIDECVMQNDLTWLLTVAAVVFSFFTLHFYRKNLIAYESCAICLCLFIALFMMKVSMKNPFLIYCGEHLFSLFILQRIPMILLRNTAVASNDYVYFFVCLGITFLLSLVFDRIVPLLWTKASKLVSSVSNERV